jgi:serine phosphatase RsbU (regulator of sigma subunit)
LFYTGGSSGHETDGEPRLRAPDLRLGGNLGADDLLERLMADVSRFVGGVEQHDDLTIVVGRVT